MLTLADVQRILRHNYTTMANITLNGCGRWPIPRHRVLVAQDQKALARITGDLWLRDQAPTQVLGEEAEGVEVIAALLDLEDGSIIAVRSSTTEEEVRDCLRGLLLRRNPFTGGLMEWS